MRAMKMARPMARSLMKKSWSCPQCDFPIDVLWNGRYCRHCGVDNTGKYLRFPARLQRKRRKLLAVFDALRVRGVEAWPVFMDCTSAAETGIRRLARKHKKLGFAYWHWQDEDAFWQEGTIHIGFGAAVNDGGLNALVGRMVVRALRKAGLRVVWSGDVRTKVQVC